MGFESGEGHLGFVLAHHLYFSFILAVQNSIFSQLLRNLKKINHKTNTNRIRGFLYISSFISEK